MKTRIDELALVAASRRLTVRAEIIRNAVKYSELAQDNIEWIRKHALQARLDAESVLASLEVPSD